MKALEASKYLGLSKAELIKLTNTGRIKAKHELVVTWDKKALDKYLANKQDKIVLHDLSSCAVVATGD
jgi:hypothetical protein